MKLKTTNKKKSSVFRAFFSCFVILSMLWTEPASVQAQTSVPHVEVVVGYHNNIKYGSFAPVKVRISENHARAGGTVELFLSFQEEEQYYYRTQYPAGQEEAEVSFCVAMPEVYRTDAYMEVKISDENGDEVYQSRVGYQGNDQGSQIYVGVLTDRYEGMDYWDELQLESVYQMGGRTIPLSADEIPEESQSLDMLDMILVKGFGEDQLNEAQKQALEDWVYDGGVLLLDGEIRPEGVKTSVYPFLKVDQTEGNISVTESGKGRIIGTDFDTEEFSYIIQNEGDGMTVPSIQSADELMELLMGEARLQGIYQDGYRGSNQIQEFIHKTISADGITTPSFGIYVLILFCYILILVPCCYLLLRKKGYLEWLRPAILVLALLGSGVIFLAGKNTRFSEPFIHYLEVDEYLDAQVVETVYATLQAPYNKTYEVSLDPSYQILPVTDQWVADKERERTEEITVEDGEYRVQFSDSTAFQEESFRLKKKNKAISPVTADIHLFDGETTGTVENQMTERLEDVILMMPEHAVSLGTLEPGESITLDDIPSISYKSVTLEDMNLEDIWGFTDDANQLKSIDQKHRSLIESYLWTSYEKSPCLIGFIKESDGEIQQNSEYVQYGERMVVIYVDVDTTKDGWEYYPSVPMESRIVFGTFYGIRDSMMEGDSGVIAYTLDGEYEIEELTFHMDWDAARDEKKVTEIYFLNPVTGEYTLVYPGKSTFTGEELQDYINMNEIYIKFRSTAENGETSRLPRISMIGRKRNVGNQGAL